MQLTHIDSTTAIAKTQIFPNKVATSGEPERFRRDSGTDRAFYRTVCRPLSDIKAIHGVSFALGSPPVSKPQQESATSPSQHRLKSLPNVKLVAHKSQSRPKEREGERESVIGRIYKGIFTPGVGRVLGSLVRRPFVEDLRCTETFLTSRRGMEEAAPERTWRPAVPCIAPELESPGRVATSRLRAATDKLVDEVMSSPSHSLRSQFLKFVETGDRRHIFYCDMCPHCRMLNKDFYPVRQRLAQQPAGDEYFFDYFDLNTRLKSSKVWNSVTSGRNFVSTRRRFHRGPRSLSQSCFCISWMS